MRYENSSPLRYSTLRGGVCVVEGYGVRVHVRHGRLHVCDGIADERRERVYTRVSHGLARLVVLGHAGSITLEALRWLLDLGIAFIQVDRDGRVVVTSAAGPDDARLRRAQALAATNETGVEIARLILGEKLGGQRRTLERLSASTELAEEFTSAEERLEEATTINELVMAERDAALAYWSAWARVEIRFRRSDLAKLPDHWSRFGQRGSPLTSAPRLAVNPVNALLNYLYAILEAETRIACLALGLDPSLGIVHADFRSRDSLALDLMEAVRPGVDAYVLDLLEQTFKASDFHETSRGVCRLLSPLTHLLAQTAPTWGRLIAPVAERAAKALADAPGSRIERLATPLTNTNRRAARAPMRRRPAPETKPRLPKPPPLCRGCGGEIPHPDRMYCNGCLPEIQAEQQARFTVAGPAALARLAAEGRDQRHEGEAARKRAAANSRHKREAAAWEREHGRADPAEFAREILPTIQAVPLRRLMEATGLSLRHCSLVRRGAAFRTHGTGPHSGTAADGTPSQLRQAKAIASHTRVLMPG